MTIRAILLDYGNVLGGAGRHISANSAEAARRVGLHAIQFDREMQTYKVLEDELKIKRSC